MDSKGDDLQGRRRRALYRAQHRGSREMDWLLGRYAEAVVPGMAEERLGKFERLLEMADPELHGWILEPTRISRNELTPFIDDLRRYHGLGV